MTQEITCSVDAGGHWTLDGTVRAECTGADTDGSACLSLVVSMPQGAVTVVLDGDETRRLRAQIDEVLR